nr:hypothetical protein [Klebsiella oxytoca]
MDSEPVELPLDYLQGHKDGLEWAAQLAKANHPETGDWLYDDPIELAKAISKGPDMPPSQPALDTEPVAYTDERNLGYIDRGRETAYLWGKQNSEAGDVPLYRHAQPAPVVRPAPECEHQWRHGGANKLQNQKQCIKCGRVELDAQPAPVVPVVPDAATAIRACLSEFPESVRDIVEECADIAENACRAAMLQAEPVTTANKLGNSPVIPDGYVMVPKEPTPEMLEVINEAIKSMRGSAATYARVLAAAPQEVPDGK